jgi:hypothetical protein
MGSIGALYHASLDEDALDDEEVVDAVYVMNDYFRNAGEQLNTISDLKDIFGDPVYAGNSNVILAEAISINLLNQTRNALNGRVKMELDQTFSDVAEVESFDRNYVVYITSFQRGDIIYSFVSGADDNLFSFYFITSGDEDSEASA